MIFQEMLQKSFLKCCISNKLVGTEDHDVWQEDAMKLKMKTVIKWQKVVMKIKMKKCGMMIKSNII